MKHSFFLRFLVPKSFANYAYNYFVDNEEYLYYDPHAVGKLVALFRDIPGFSANKKTIKPTTFYSSSPISIFQETDSILGVINFSRRGNFE